MTALAEMTKSKASEPERRCLATGDRTPKFGLLRFVVSPNGEVVPDLGERLPGRGLWLSSDRDALKTAVDKKLFARAVKAEVTVPSDITDRIETMLMKRCQDIIGLARRSDLLVIGFDRVLEVLDRRSVGLVVIATDAGGGRRDIMVAAEDLPVVSGMTCSEMGEAAGKGVVSFMTILRGGLAKSLNRECERLTGFRPVEMDGRK
ncbi:DUF448 domain-containing protein [Rhodospirillales bacterium]|nr:DUF448 domain-containing protein [Rhodospirillales bacterium]